MSRLGPRTSTLVSTAVVVLLTLGVWWLQSSDDGDPVRPGAVGSASVDSPVDSAADSPVDRRVDEEDGADLPVADAHGLLYVDLADLPPEAAEVMARIDAGGPYDFPDRDGSTFGNLEGLLPDQPRGYYAEYTVETPGLDHRGARRIVAGDGGERYWTADHYASFQRIRR